MVAPIVCNQVKPAVISNEAETMRRLFNRLLQSPVENRESNADYS